MLFDIRTIVGALLGCYAIVLVVTGLVHDTAAEQAKTGGVNVNLWAGLGMGVVAVAFVAWALLRPVQVPPQPQPADRTDEESDSA
ncbi:hypothetical protein IU450_13730 [Nocardia abscessus]|uniref:hypothetical protein n=1 Tax=Nocardia abscessus TaxID=120957 RepID=UPI00189431AB|nr:hypothetical protein [Nocardia abscessus]MBF6336939.1 hypothetical protein [Nocardia abscessus]